MNTWKNFRYGLSSYLQVPATLSKHRLWHYQLIPALVSLVITSLMFILMFWLANLLRVWVGDNWHISIAGFRELMPVVMGIGAFLLMAVAFFFLHKHKSEETEIIKFDLRRLRRPARAANTPHAIDSILGFPALLAILFSSD